MVLNSAIHTSLQTWLPLSFSRSLTPSLTHYCHCLLFATSYSFVCTRLCTIFVRGIVLPPVTGVSITLLTLTACVCVCVCVYVRPLISTASHIGITKERYQRLSASVLKVCVKTAGVGMYRDYTGFYAGGSGISSPSHISAPPESLEFSVRCFVKLDLLTFQLRIGIAAEPISS